MEASLLFGALLLLCGCASANAPTVAAPVTPARSSTPSTQPTATRSPAAVPTAPLVDPGQSDPEAALALAWSGVDPLGSAAFFAPAIAPDGRIWAAVVGQNQFMVFDADGTYIETWGVAGAEEGQINLLHGSDSFGGIVFARDGSYFISESGNRRVSKFDAEGNFVLAWGSFGSGDDQFLTPNDIAIDGADNVYVHDDELGLTKMFASDGEFVRTFAPGSGPFAAVSEDGHVFAATDANDLNEYAPDGTLIRTIVMAGLAANPRISDVAVDSAGNIWVASVRESGPRDEPDKLIELDRDGNLLHRYDGMAVTQLVIGADGDRIFTTFWHQLSVAAFELPGG